MAAKKNQTAAEGAKSFSAKLRYARITARKARLVADLIRGRTVNQALEVLGFEHKRAASFYSGLVRSAMANAGQEEGVNVNQLVVTDCRADDGPMLQGRMRFRPGPQGRAHPFKKLTSHLTVVVSQPVEVDGKRRRGAKSKSAAGSKSAAKRKAAAANAQ